MLRVFSLILISQTLQTFLYIETTAFTDNRTFYTIEEQEALQQILPLVEKFLLRDYMFRDEFLIQFIRAKKFDVKDAAKMILKNMKWREENQIENVIEEENSVERNFLYYVAIDRENRPVIMIKLGDHDLRKTLLSGKRFQAERTCWKIMEGLLIKARLLNVSQVVGVMDLTGFSYRQHACRECMSYGQHMAQAIEENYPGLAAKFFIINSPRIVEVILNIVRSVLHENTKKVIDVYGFDKDEWTNALLKYVSPEQLSLLFGNKFSNIKAKHRSPNHIRHEDSRSFMLLEEDAIDELENIAHKDSHDDEHYSANISLTSSPTYSILVFQLVILFYLLL